MTSNAVAYLDYNASAPVCAHAVNAVQHALAHAGNPSSVHRAGRIARRMLEDARETVAALVRGDPTHVVFTSGGTEANNLALSGWPGEHLYVSAIEHPSVLAAVRTGTPRLIPVDAKGRVDLDAFAEMAAVAAPGSLVSVMLANNETGVIQAVTKVTEIARRYGLLVHCDAIQAAGKIPVDVVDLGADMVTLSAHKIGGPQGVGALLVRNGVDVGARIRGGGQEKGRRGGTENVPGIAGFGAAADEALVNLADAPRIAELRDRFEARLQDAAPDMTVIGAGVERLPNTSCLTMPGTDSEVQVMAFDLAGVLVSAGSACSSGKVGPSHVLEAMGIPPDVARTAIRVSLGISTTELDLNRFVDAWTALYRRTIVKDDNRRTAV